MFSFQKTHVVNYYILWKILSEVTKTDEMDKMVKKLDGKKIVR